MSEIRARSEAIARGESVPLTQGMIHASVRKELRAVMSELTEDDEAGTVPWSRRIALAHARRAATGNPQALQLLYDQVDGPVQRDDNRGDWQVTINYVHQQAIVQAPDSSLPSPTTPA